MLSCLAECLGWPSRAVGLEPLADGCRLFSRRRRAPRTADAAGRRSEPRARGPDLRGAVAGHCRHSLPHGVLRLAAIELLVNLLGGLAVVGLTWLLFPAAVTLIMSFYLERVAAAVEAVDYPGRGPPRRQSVGEIVSITLRLTLLTLLLNLLALPVYLLVPGINLFLFLALNGYLFGRGYFEVVALRRLDMGAARRVRSRFAGRIFLGGVVIAGLFALPLVNLVAPVIATAFMLHIFEALPRPVDEYFRRTP